jgi:hypothetical protein
MIDLIAGVAAWGGSRISNCYFCSKIAHIAYHDLLTTVSDPWGRCKGKGGTDAHRCRNIGYSRWLGCIIVWLARVWARRNGQQLCNAILKHCHSPIGVGWRWRCCKQGHDWRRYDGDSNARHNSIIRVQLLYPYSDCPSWRRDCFGGSSWPVTGVEGVLAYTYPFVDLY